MRLVVSIGLAALAALSAPAPADAFCGFYVSGADAKLFNNATQVVLMRQGTRTVLSMQNNYQGPPKDFAMVVPVPVVLEKENVKTLPREVFARIDQLSAPRLVEYWEADPCQVERYDMEEGKMGKRESTRQSGQYAMKSVDLGVTIEAKFTVGEYQILILSAKDSTGLDTWLRQEKYKIPDGAEPYLRPYVEAGSKFFVAKVDIEKVKFENGQAMLSPLRFHYDSDQFSLPIRLGMMNSAGTQDLIVHVLAPSTRYEVANYKNVTIPTNLDVKEEARERFGEFYAALFDRVVYKNPGAVVTEYSWDSGSCDPCPTPALTPDELGTFGADVIGLAEEAGMGRGRFRMRPSFVLTRLHARYAKDAIGEDLVFKEASAILGGREIRNEQGKLEEGATPSEWGNNFQARYAIRHEWTGPINCSTPIRGRWGGPLDGAQQAAGPKAATDLAFVPRGRAQLGTIVRQDIPEIDIRAGVAEAPLPQPVSRDKSGRHNPGACSAGGGAGGWLAALLLLALVFATRHG